MALDEVLHGAGELLDRRGVVGGCYVAIVLLAQIRLSNLAWHQWDDPALLFGAFVLGFCIAHGFYEALLGPYQWLASDRIALWRMRRAAEIASEDKSVLKKPDDFRRFREWLLEQNLHRRRQRIETHENARRNSTYLFTSSVGAITVTSVLPLVGAGLQCLPIMAYAILAGLGVLWLIGSVYRSLVLGRDLGYAFVENKPKYVSYVHSIAGTNPDEVRKNRCCTVISENPKNSVPK